MQRAPMRHSGERVFTYPWWYPWVGLFPWLFSTTITIGSLLNPPSADLPSSTVDVVVRWVMLAFFGGFSVVLLRAVILGLIDPYRIIVSEEAIQGYPLVGQAVRAAWSDVQFLDDHGEGRTRLLVPGRRPIVFRWQLRGYEDLRKFAVKMASTKGRGPHVFSYPSDQPWSSLFLMVVMIAVPVVVLIAVRPILPPGWDMLLYAWPVIAALPVALSLLTLATTPGTARTVEITDHAIIGYPLWSRPVRIDWEEVQRVDVRRGFPAGWGPETVRVVARDGLRTIKFDEGMKPYKELKHVVLNRARRR